MASINDTNISEETNTSNSPTDMNEGSGKPAAKTPRSRNAESTKKTILECARKSFAANSYDAVGLREIASAAKIDPALIIRYFGSKEGLFREILEKDMFTQSLAQMDSDKFLQELIRWTLMPAQSEESMTALLVILRSVTSETASPVIRSCIQKRILEPLSKSLGDPEAAERSEMVIAILVGLATYRHVLKLEKLSDGNFEKRIAMVTPFLTQLLHGKL